ncbi:hypothetical protein JKF63_06490 [Porcisia hertigi]|uniref:C2HC/C3H-type domain-containing protein n=1 Tax=Porcisia hertigi TaxID=2761500 RepID=A0A836IA56_9TRYP|nr:hypothetical protein JKF63_06490 [Porcisia hertigi]
MRPLMAGSKSASQRPQLRVCYLCGQQFGSTSIGIHVPQCYQKKLSQWEVNDPAVRGPKPKHPDSVKWKGGNGVSAEAINKEQYQEYNAQLVPCPNCARTFLPDRLPVHLRGCKGNSKEAASQSKRKAGSIGGNASGGGARKGEPQSASRNRALSSGPPVLPTCYLCGQQFGTASIGIHVPQCYEKKLAQWQNADPHLRGQPPKHPDTVNWRGRSDASAREQAEDQFQEFINNLEPCPNCGRKFLPDRLVVHLRSCRRDNPAKAVSPSNAKSGGSPAVSPRPSTPAATAADTGNSHNIGGSDASRSGRPQTQEQQLTSSTSEDRINPKRNRLPRSTTIPAESRECPQCKSVEYGTDAKFCRECGHSFTTKGLSDPCQHCGERIPRGSRFCGTCGQPVHDASEPERTPGGSNENVSAARSVVCPACKAISDIDGNFCDNCGAALGTAGATPSPKSATAASSAPRSAGATPRRTQLHCTKCKETVEDTAAIFCEDCGGRLEKLESSTEQDGGPSQGASCTLPPLGDVRRTGAKVEKPQRPTASEPQCKASLPVVNPASRVPSAGRTVRPSEDECDNTEGPLYGEDDAERLPCSHCGRRFAPESLARHEHVCASQKKRRVFNATKQRQPEGAPAPRRDLPTKAPNAPKRDWKAESEAFRRALREARQVDQVLKAGGTAKDLPPPTYSVNPDYIPCPHCQRRFAPDVASRHIPRCANTVNRPKPPPRRR